MKRGADIQLTKDKESDDEIEEVSSGPFRKADDAVLASRPMRGLPKRSLSAAPPLETPDAPTPKFTGFAGFGTPPTATSPPTSTGTTLPQSSFLFNVPPTSSIPIAPTASDTAKSFASFLNNTSSSPPAVPTPPFSQKNSSDAPEVDNPVALKYYTSLRGLNVSFLAAVSKATQEDPFKDVAELLELYKTMRLKIRNEFDERPKEPSHESSAPPAILSMPAPPAKFAGFNALTSSTPGTSDGSNGGFTPQATPPPVSSSGFSFSVPAPKATPPPTTGFSFAIPPPSQAAKTNPFSFPTTSSPFGAPPSTSPFSVPPKNTSSSSSTSTFTFGAATATSTPSSTVFANTTPSTATIFGSGTGSSSPFSSTTPPKTNSFGSFGGFGKSSGGNIGNPVGFGFGSPTKTSDAHEKEEANGSDEPHEGNGGTEDGQPKIASFGLLGTNPHDEEGEGEEDEDTVHGVKVKAFRMKKSDEGGGPGWVEIGLGVLRLKKHKETKARRVLLRNSDTGRINLNFSLYAGLKVTQNKKTLTFIGHDSGVSQTYSVRLQSEEEAKTLKDIFDSEIADIS